VAENGFQAVVAALILGVCMLGGAFMLSQSVDRMTAQIPEIEGAINNLQTAMAAGGAAQAKAAPEAKRRRGPDPNKVYTVATAGSHTKGPANAKVTLIEFSDFQ
jgi:outer membrane murein-binding lipoprotein Lpp